MTEQLVVDEAAPFDWNRDASVLRVARAWEGLRVAVVGLGEASRECAESWRRFSRAFRYSKRAVQTFRTFHGRLPRGWRKHVRRMKAERRRARA